MIRLLTKPEPNRRKKLESNTLRKRKDEALKGVRLDTGEDSYLMSADRAGRKVAGLMQTDDGAWIAAWYRSGGVSGRAVGPTPRDALEKALERALQMDYQEMEA